MFEPLRTRRLQLRPGRIEDAAIIVEVRGHPEVARYQDWITPFPLKQAEAMASAGPDGPTPGAWWMLTIADIDDTRVYGDLSLHLDDQGKTARLGYNLDPQQWGNGYATEAVEALVQWLFERGGVVRIEATVDPDNAASAMVLERTGFLFEGRHRLASWVADVNSDDFVYGITRADWETWRSRSAALPQLVELVEMSPDTAGQIGKLRTHKSQERFVAPVRGSYADALFPEVIDGAPVVPWLRGVRADGGWVGFVMIAEVTEHHTEPYLWRLLIDRVHQRRGIGKRVLDLVVADIGTSGAATLVTSWVEGRGSPRPFYEAYGFEPTGEVVDGETEARLRF